MTWMAAVRDHPDRPPAMQRHVLNSLALRMDWSTGCGFASTGQLAADAGADERTIRRATKWGREHDMLVQSRRGHRVSSERVIASEWRLTVPGETQQDTGVRLEGKANRTGRPAQPDSSPEPTGQGGRPNRTPQHHHQELGPQDLVPSVRGRASANGARAGAQPETCPWCGPAITDGHLPGCPHGAGVITAARPICPKCGRPFSAETLADPYHLASALRGQLCCRDCKGSRTAITEPS